MVEGRSFRGLEGDPYLYLGSAQHNKVQSWMLNGNVGYKLKGIFGQSPIDPYDQGDSWGSVNANARTERDNLIAYIKTNNIQGVHWVGGDRHYYQHATVINTQGLNVVTFLSSGLNKSALATMPNTSTKITAISRDGSNTVTVTTSSAHHYVAGETVHVHDVTGGATSFNGGPFTILSSGLTATQFKYTQVGGAESGTVNSASTALSDNVIWRGNAAGSIFMILQYDTTIANPSIVVTCKDKADALLTGLDPAGNSVNATSTILASYLNTGITPPASSGRRSSSRRTRWYVQ